AKGQLSQIVGLDRDNALINELFDENNAAIKAMIQQTIAAAKKHNIPIGLCGQAPSDFPEFAQFLVTAGIDSISFNADALLQGIENIQQAEARFAKVV
ncbi:MAG: putative PEP-binding protein, partial [Bacteroidota bacterium]